MSPHIMTKQSHKAPLRPLPFRDVFARASLVLPLDVLREVLQACLSGLEEPVLELPMYGSARGPWGQSKDRVGPLSLLACLVGFKKASPFNAHNLRDLFGRWVSVRQEIPALNQHRLVPSGHELPLWRSASRPRPSRLAEDNLKRWPSARKSLIAHCPCQLLARSCHSRNIECLRLFL